MSDIDLTAMTVRELDEFAAWAHAVHDTPGVEIVTGPVDDHNAPHGLNDETETQV